MKIIKITLDDTLKEIFVDDNYSRFTIEQINNINNEKDAEIEKLKSENEKLIKSANEQIVETEFWRKSSFFEKQPPISIEESMTNIKFTYDKNHSFVFNCLELTSERRCLYDKKLEKENAELKSEIKKQSTIIIETCQWRANEELKKLNRPSNIVFKYTDWQSAYALLRDEYVELKDKYDDFSEVYECLMEQNKFNYSERNRLDTELDEYKDTHTYSDKIIFFQNKMALNMIKSLYKDVEKVKISRGNKKILRNGLDIVIEYTKNRMEYCSLYFIKDIKLKEKYNGKT